MIGLFDSGVGGLSVVREIVRQLPPCPLVYLADQSHAPYGSRPLAEIRDFTGGITRFLLEQGAQVIVVACNTASAAALRWLRREFPAVPFVGMEPALKPAAERTRTRHVGVIATAATFQGELFASLVDRYAADVTVHTQVCARLVPLVEAGELDTPLARAAVEEYLAPLVAAGVDELVLGCTHYPFLQPLIEEVIGPDVEVIDPAAAVARQAGRVLAQAGWMIGDERNVIEGDCFVPQGCCAIANDAPRSGGHCRDAFGPAVWGTRNDGALDRFYTTGDPARFEDALQRLLGFRAVVQPAMWNTDGQLRLPR